MDPVLFLKSTSPLFLFYFSYLSLSVRFSFPLLSLSIIYFILYSFIIETTDFCSMACLWREHNAGYRPIGQRLSDHDSLTLHHSTAPSCRLTPRSQTLYPNCQVICIEPNTRTCSHSGIRQWSFGIFDAVLGSGLSSAGHRSLEMIV
jgi:hypothetical protein